MAAIAPATTTTTTSADQTLSTSPSDSVMEYLCERPRTHSLDLSTSTETPILELNADVLIAVAEFLPVADVLSLASTCTDLLWIRRDNLLWSQLYSSKWGTPPKQRSERLQSSGGSISWVEEYFYRASLNDAVIFEFNKRGNLADAIAFLEDEGLVDTSDPTALNDFLFSSDLVSRTIMSEYFTLYPDSLATFIERFDFSGMDCVTGFRTFLENVRLPRSSQNMRKMLHEFEDVFFDANEAELVAKGWSAATVYLFAHSVLLLNVDAYNPMVKRKMTLAQFAESMSHICPEVSDDDVAAAYNDIKREAFAMGAPVVLLQARAHTHCSGIFSNWKAATVTLSAEKLGWSANANAPADSYDDYIKPRPLRVTVEVVDKMHSVVIIPLEDVESEGEGEGEGVGVGVGEGEGENAEADVDAAAAPDNNNADNADANNNNNNNGAGAIAAAVAGQVNPGNANFLDVRNLVEEARRAAEELRFKGITIGFGSFEDAEMWKLKIDEVINTAYSCRLC